MIVSRRELERAPTGIALTVLQSLMLHVNCPDGNELSVYPTELEVYCIPGDPACRRRLHKTALKFLPAGAVWIYYVHHYPMFNIVVGDKLRKALIFIRSGLIVYMNSKLIEPVLGPGRLSRKMCITRSISGTLVHDLSSPIRLVKSETDEREKAGVEASYRIGLRKEHCIRLRYYLKNPELVSKGKISSPTITCGEAEIEYWKELRERMKDSI